MHQVTYGSAAFVDVYYGVENEIGCDITFFYTLY